MTAWTNRTAIVGIGQTEFSTDSGRTERRLAVEAITAALDEAGLSAADVDGVVTFDVDSNDPASLASTLGLPPLSYFASTLYGRGGGCATIMQRRWRSPAVPPTW